MKYKLGDICFYAKGKVDVTELTENNYISTENMLSNKGGVTTASSLPRTVQTQQYQQYDTLVSNIRPYFKKIWFAESDGGCSNDVLVLRAKEGIDAKFLYYVLADDAFFDYSNATSKGTKMPRGDKNAIMQYPVPAFDLETQQKIAGILSDIDDKIELNRQINDNLLQQAQATFQNELLSVQTLPAGCKQASLIDIADYLNGLAMQKYRPENGEMGIPVLKIKELRQGYCDDSSELCSPNIKSDYIVHDGDVVFSWSGSLLVDFWCGGTCGLNQHLFKVTSAKYDKWFYYAWTKHHLDRFIAVAADKATTMGHIKRDELAKATVLIPAEDDYKRIGELFQPIYNLIIAKRIENKHLAETRDTLLPKLMSGEIDVSNIQL